MDKETLVRAEQIARIFLSMFTKKLVLFSYTDKLLLLTRKKSTDLVQLRTTSYKICTNSSILLEDVSNTRCSTFQETFTIGTLFTPFLQPIIVRVFLKF
jgi:hypothetical protein